MLVRLWDKYGLLVRYGVSGITGATIQVAFLAFWVEVLYRGDHAYYRKGVVIGFCLAVVATFLLQKFWTFRDASKERARRQFVLYGIFALLNFLGTTGAMYILVDRLHIWYLAANVGTVGTLAIMNFLANRYLTFRSALQSVPGV